MNEKLLFTIIDKFSSAAIGELDYNDGTSHLILRKEQRGTGAAAQHHAAPPPHAASAEVHLGIAAVAAKETPLGDKITSPIVATFYAAPSPDAPPFAKPGSKIKSGQTLCILEAMKMMNHLEAEFDCEVLEVHAASGELVEYGQDLFTVKRL